MEHEGFRAGDFTTHFVDEQFDPAALELEDPERDELAALAATLYYAETQSEEARTIAANGQGGQSPWRRRRHP
jgi:propionyl-CoA carboxylase alpha chain